MITWKFPLACCGRWSALIYLFSPIVLSVPALWLPKNIFWINAGFHSTLDAISAVTSILVALMILFFISWEQTRELPVAIPLGLITLGTLKLLHATFNEPTESFIWLQTAALLLSGLLFATIYLPFGQVAAFQQRRQVFWIAGLIFVIGMLILIWPNINNYLFFKVNKDFSLLLEILNFLGASFFLLAAVRFMQRFICNNAYYERFFALLCAFYSILSLIIYHTQSWNLAWWWLHVLSWIVHGIACYYLLFAFARTIDKHYRTEAYLLAVIDSSSDAIIGTQLDGSINLWNPAATKIFGYTVKQALQQPLQKLLPMLQHHLDPSEIANSCSSYETKHNVRDGKSLELAVSCAPIQDWTQQIIGMVQIVHDLTAIRAASSALRDQEEQFRQIFERISSGVVIYEGVDHGKDFIFTDVNPAVERIERLQRTELIGKRVTEAFPGVEKFGFLAVLQRVWVSGNAEVFPLKFYQDQRIAGWRENEVYKLSSGRVVAIYEDVTERKQAEEEVRYARDRLLLAVRVAEVGIWSWDFTTDLLTWDQRMYDLYAISEEERAAGVNYELWRQRCHPFDRPVIESELLTARHNNTSFDGHFRICLPDGRIRYIQAAALVECEYTGLPLRMVGINRDITQQCETEEILRKAKEAADSANHAKSAFLANMSHEIRTPLNGVIGLTQLLLETELDIRQRDYLNKIKLSSKTLLGLLNDILDYSKIEAGYLTLEQIDFPLDDLLDHAEGLFALTAESKGLELLFEVAPNVPPILCGDSLRLGQVINNLLGNAVKFTKRGEIHLIVECLEQNTQEIYLRFTVRDTGIGITPAQLRQLFQAFHQGDSTTTRQYGGTGLGLTISKRIVELMNGELKVESIPAQGSTFFFTVRLKRSTRTPQRHLERLRGMKTLVVDDHPTSREVLARLLQAWNFTVTLADSGESALSELQAAQLAGEPFELTLLDWKMPGMNGLVLTDHIENMKKNGLLHPAPVIIMVTAHGRDCIDTSYTAKLNGWVEKPVKPSTLFDLIVGIQEQVSTWPPDRTRHEQQTLRERTHAIQGARILVVEDVLTNRIVTRDFLLRLGLIVETANDGREAVMKFKHRNYDAILMDLQMPNLDGLQATQEIRALPNGQTVPIIALTAAILLNNAADTKAAGMNDYLTKPVDLEHLANALLRWIPSIDSPKLEFTSSPLDASSSEIKLIHSNQEDNLYKERLQELEDLLIRRHGRARSLARELKQELTASPFIEPMAELEHKVQQLRFNEALNTLRALLAQFTEEE